MHGRTAFRPAGRRRWMIYSVVLVGGVLLLAAGAVALHGRALAGELARTVLARAGVVTQTLAVRSLGFGGIVFDARRLGGPAGPPAPPPTVGWPPGGSLPARG